MTPGFRYHVTTIAAIFLALGVGIIIGSSFVQSQIVERQTRRLEALGEQFNREIAPLRDSNRRYAEFIQALTPSVIGGKLTGIRVALIQTGDYPETTIAVRDTLKRAGAQVESETVIPPNFTALAGERQEELSRMFPGHSDPPDTPEELLRTIAEALGTAGRHRILEPLASADLLETSGEYSRPTSFIVVIGGATTQSGPRAETIDLPLIQALKPLVNTVVAVEPSGAEVSYIAALRAAEIPTVDNAETDIGKIALVLSIMGPSGDYGIKQTARSGALPPPAQR